MAELLAFALIGLGSGALVAGLAAGVVLNYRGCGAVNLGLGAVAMLGAYIFYGLRSDGDLILPPIAGLESLDLGDPWPVVPALLVKGERSRVAPGRTTTHGQLSRRNRAGGRYPMTLCRLAGNRLHRRRSFRRDDASHR